MDSKGQPLQLDVEGAKLTENDSVRMLMKLPEIPVGGRLKHFLPNWKKITQDNWVLSIIQQGYKLEFLEKPVFNGVKESTVNVKKLDIIQKEIHSLLEKDVIVPVSENQKQSGFYSTIFLVEKKTGGLRPVINLRPLNKYLRKIHFKMDTLSTVLNLVKKGDYAISIDLRDAYFHIGIHPKHQKYLRFCFQGQAYQFKALCFGPTSAPRVFTKVIAVVAAYLRKWSIRLATYLDDWIALKQNVQELILDRERILGTLVDLGFIVNLTKSHLVPNQMIEYIGASFYLHQGLVFPTQARVTALKLGVRKILKGMSTAHDYLHLLGLIASCLQLIPHARLFMRPIQLHLLKHWKAAVDKLNKVIPFSHSVHSHMIWWLQEVNILKGKSFVSTPTVVTITSDASGTGWGGHMNNQMVQGTWSEEQSTWHINCLEMQAVLLTMKHFLPFLRQKSVLVRSDNMTVVQYLNKQGGTKSTQLCCLTWDLWNLAIANQIQIKAAHVAGKENSLADSLSRKVLYQTEWSLNSEIVRKIFHLWGEPLIDLFATYQNKQTSLFCTWTNHPQAYATDALSISWKGMFAYVFPPIPLIARVLAHMRQFQCQIILIAPRWPRRHWYPQLLELLVANPIVLPVQENLLSQNKIWHPDPENLNLTAWLLSTDSLKQKVFRQKLENCSPNLGDRVPKKTTPQNLENSVAGVVKEKLIPIQFL
jgi:hypothetical protein